MKHLQRILVLALSAILVITACIPGTLASRTVEPPEATAPETTAGTESTVPETTAGTENTVPETGTAASEQPEAPMEQKPVSTDERYTVSFDLGGGILTARGVDRSVTAAPGETITLPGAPEKEDRTFTGWLSAKSGETYQAEADYKVTDDDTLTAQWNMLQVLGVNTELGEQQHPERDGLCGGGRFRDGAGKRGIRREYGPGRRRRGGPERAGCGYQLPG